MTPITPEKLLPLCDMVMMNYFENIPFKVMPSGVLMVHNILSAHVYKACECLYRNGRYIVLCREGDDPFQEWIIKEFPQVKRWFVLNCELVHEKVEAMPFGISFGSTGRTTDHIKYINDLLEKPKCKINDVFACFSINNNERSLARDYIKNKSFGTWSERLGVNEYLNGIYNHDFMLSPQGNGLDCVRTWESLYLKTYPIVKNSQTYNHFSDMPIAIVNNWSNITPDWLSEQKEILDKKSRERIYVEYWIDRINSAKRRYL